MSIESQPASQAPPPTDDQTSRPRYLEVWGDTVAGRDLAVSVVIGIVVSVCALLGATAFFHSFVTDSSLADAYALLVGIAACLVAGVVSGKLFRPKRNIAVDSSEGDKVGDVIRVLQEERQGLGSVSDLPAQTVQELKDLDLYDRFAEAETHGTGGRS
ncbi:hypothetical protein P3H15_10990 [Rhodococcus sp. T2V]|uniref:hypothetical protein n=1 Tax=Rhodococcus sp. T2V TaxID=3034164 RepID=UPI0023E2C874|nr:hypothetical protein [Rhodococcus sp. T2V]MDF3305547.1 hypothetical protein [Rhodococcus sp. T2V]